MKSVVYLALAAAAIGVSAQPAHNHQHLHRQAKKHAHAGAEKRDVATVTTVVPATVTQYVLDGESVDVSKAKEGIEQGLYVVVGSSTPTFTPPPAPSSTTPTATQGAQFIEIKSSSSAAAPTSSAVPTASSSSNETSGGTGVDSEFPDGKIPCSQFPSDYGALGVSWLNTGLWTSLQQFDYSPGVLATNIVAGVSGGTCTDGCMCSYACPPGYEKTQWPESSQGANGESVGGLYCKNGYLTLTRPSHTKLCTPGAGGVTVVNNLSGSAAICRTDYPGSEAMVIPIDTKPGGTYPLNNPIASDTYKWKGSTTSAQYYLNPLNVAVEDACVWTSPTNPSSAGNWAPIIIGLGQSESGTSFLSIFPNAPTSTAALDFNIKISGDNNGECSLINGKYPDGSTTSGCTTGIPQGGSVTITFY